MSKKLSTKEYSYSVIYEPIKQGGYHVMVPLLPGLVTYGRTFEEARKMARDAVECYVESLAEEKEVIPEETGFLQERIAVYA